MQVHRSAFAPSEQLTNQQAWQLMQQYADVRERPMLLCLRDSMLCFSSLKHMHSRLSLYHVAAESADDDDDDEDDDDDDDDDEDSDDWEEEATEAAGEGDEAEEEDEPAFMRSHVLRLLFGGGGRGRCAAQHVLGTGG